MQNDIILKFVLQNALKYGKADAKAVMGKVLSEVSPTDKRALLKEIARVVREVHTWSAEKRLTILQALAPELLKKKEIAQQDLKELRGASPGHVRTRLAPEPSKYLHIGHALVFAINYLYAEKYGGSCILRLEDTNPEKVTQEYVDAMLDDLQWLGLVCAETVVCSDRLDLYYKYAEQLIADGKAYTCLCPRETLKTLRAKKKRCACAAKGTSAVKKEWIGMLQGSFKPGERNLRLVGDMRSDNGVLRDPVIFRISDRTHYKQKNKYCVWPMYDLTNAVEDSVERITHIIRSKEFELRLPLHNLIKDYLRLEKHHVIEIGRFNVIGATTQGREIRALIEQKKVSGWDDPRLVTLRALRRRGFVAATFLMLARQIGLSKSPTNIDWQLLAAFNRKVLDPTTKRYFFVEHPRNITISGAPSFKVSVPFHPDKKKLGARNFATRGEFYIADSLQTNKFYRLMHLFNFKNRTFISKELDQQLDAQLIHWLPVTNDLVNVEVLMPDGTTTKGLAEPAVRDLRTGEIVQFPRFGFCRFDHVTNETYAFWYAHR